MPLLTLPNELLQNISERLSSERDINSFAQANHRLYRLLNGYLYRRHVQQSGSSTLLWAARYGHKATAKMLLDNGADASVQGGYFGNALHAASARGNEQVVDLLLNNGVDINAPGRRYNSALQAACEGGHERVVILLLQKGADVNIHGGELGNALQAASASGHKQIVELLLQQGADINTQGGHYGNALQAAAKGGHKQVIDALRANGARERPTESFQRYIIHGSIFGPQSDLPASITHLPDMRQ
jgi:hypothetical protein